MNKLNQTLLKFELEQNFTYDDFFVSKCNYFAFSLIESWPNWEKNILNIHGEKFCGKSHLSEIFKRKNKAIIITSEEINNDFFNKIRFHEKIPMLDKAQVEYVQVQESEPLKNECLHFIDVVNKNIEPLTNGKEGLDVLNVLEAASISKTNRQVVN